jgi:glutamate-ammonia-ligase adenylyltransferase
VKLSPGGIRDIEFLVQCLQRLHGGREPWVRHGGTQFALFRLRDKGLLSGPEYSRLSSAYEFLRHLEHRLQIQDDRQTHTLPSSPEELDLLARKMPLGPLGGAASRDTLLEQLRRHQSEVRELYERVIHAQKPMYYTPPAPAPDPGGGEPPALEGTPPLLASNLARFLDSKAPALSALILRSKLVRGRERFEHFLEKIISSPVWLDRLESDQKLAECAIDLFEHSQFFGDQLLRSPDLLGVLCTSRPPGEETPEEPGELRRFFWREMLRIQSESVFERVPVFSTLNRTSDLADRVIAAAYRMAIRKRLESGPAPAGGYEPRDQMLVVALGRLGVREFDLASDADLCFILPDQDSPHEIFWTGVAEAMIDIISSYTRDGVIFTVDTRLRPNGREGALVQTEAAYKDYFANHAEAWEGIAYMKSRAVAGNTEEATRFLNELQEVDWRRYGQSGRSRAQLSEMRKRLEKEQGSRNPLKASRGGYYDIDFALMYLRLRGAGIFFKVLNTPERIDVIEKMGHIEREDADFLRDAAVYYRAIDHAMRVWSGQAGGKLPSAAAQLEVLTELVHRWTPEHLHRKTLPAQFAEIRNRTHDLFERIFR